MLSRFLDKKKQTAEGPAGVQPSAQGSLLDMMAPPASAQIAAPTNHSPPLPPSPESPLATLDGPRAFPINGGQAGTGSLLSAFNNAEAQERLRLHKAHAEMLDQQQAVAPQSSRNTQRAPLANRSPAEQLELLSEELEGLKARAGRRPSEPESSAPGHSYAPAQPQRSKLQELYSFDNFVASVARGWKQVVVFAAVGAVLAALYAVSLPNRFESIAEILIEPRGVKVLNNSVSPNGLNGDATVAYTESQVRIMYSSSVIDPVIDDLELSEDPEFAGGASGGLIDSLGRAMSGQNHAGGGRSSAKRYLMENMNVQRVSQAFTIQVGVFTSNPEKSARIANALARSYIADESGARSTVARSASEDLTARLDELRQQVRINEEKVEKYKAENGLVDANGRLVSEVQLARLNEQLVLAKVQAGDAKTRAILAKKADLADVISGSLSTNLTNATVSQLRLDYSRANAQLEKLKTKLGSRHPERIAAESERRSALNAISSEMKRMVQSAQENYKRAVARQDDLSAQVKKLKGAAVTDSAAMVKLRELNREVEASRQIYEAVLLRSRETGAEQNIRSSSARIISEAVPTYDKTGPNRKLIVAAGGVVGGGVGLGFALLPLLLIGLRQIGSGGTLVPATGQPFAGDLYSTAPQYAAHNGAGMPQPGRAQTQPPPMYYESWDAPK